MGPNEIFLIVLLISPAVNWCVGYFARDLRDGWHDIASSLTLGATSVLSAGMLYYSGYPRAQGGIFLVIGIAVSWLLSSNGRRTGRLAYLEDWGTWSSGHIKQLEQENNNLRQALQGAQVAVPARPVFQPAPEDPEKTKRIAELGQQVTALKEENEKLLRRAEEAEEQVRNAVLGVDHDPFE